MNDRLTGRSLGLLVIFTILLPVIGVSFAHELKGAVDHLQASPMSLS